MALKDLVKGGDRFGKLLLTGDYEIGKHSFVIVKCICDCGEIVYKRFDEVYKGAIKSCGKKECTSSIIKLSIKAGDRYGRFTLTGNDKMNGRVRLLEVVCDCGATKYLTLGSVRSGKSKSCGCLQKEIASKTNSTHKLSNHPLHGIWSNMKDRCYRVKNKAYKDYGGRGIKVCESWKNSFYDFYNWCISNGWVQGLDIDREDNDGHYSPDNCRFVIKFIGNRNKRNNVNITAFGETKCLTDWANDSRCSISTSGIKQRIKSGWSNEDAISLPHSRKKAA